MRLGAWGAAWGQRSVSAPRGVKFSPEVRGGCTAGPSFWRAWAAAGVKGGTPPAPLTSPSGPNTRPLFLDGQEPGSGDFSASPVAGEHEHLQRLLAARHPGSAGRFASSLYFLRSLPRSRSGLW